MSENRESVSITTESVEETAAFAAIVADFARGRSLCIELVGDVGAGKTTFTQGFVAALGSKDKVTSPTFTLENIYTSDTNIVHHFDLYRLQEAGLIPEEVKEALHEDTSIVIVEWADLLEENKGLPDDRIIIHFSPMKHSETARDIVVSTPEECELIGQIKLRMTS